MRRDTRIAIQIVSQREDKRDSIKNIPIPSLVMTKSELSAAIDNIARGYPAMTEGPVEVAYLPRSRKYQLVNGYHRMVGYLLGGQKSVEAQVSRGEWGLPPRSDRFRYQPDLPFKGLEDFIERYLLKRL